MQKDQLIDSDGRNVRHERRHEYRPIRGRAQLLDREPAHDKAEAQTHEEVSGGIPIPYHHHLHITACAVNSIPLFFNTIVFEVPALGRDAWPPLRPVPDLQCLTA